MSANNRLTQVFEASKEILFDDNSRLIFFSDCHRGDNSPADDFAHNSSTFSYALNYYFDRGFTYIEAGDGDELWENRYFSDIWQAHGDVFRIMRKFHREGRFYMILGNHDMVKKSKRFMRKNLYQYYNHRTKRFEPLFDNIEVHEGLILRYAGTSGKIFVVHGHQGDLLNDNLWPIARFLVRYILKPLELTGLKNPISPSRNYYRKGIIENNIINWVKANNQMLIAGHTHRPVFPGEGDPPYFNDGSCVYPRCITGIEIQNGEIMLIKWRVKASPDGILRIMREITAGPKKLKYFFQEHP